jgi:hypothetical protein
MTDEEAPPEQHPERDQRPQSVPPPVEDDSPLHGLFRAFRIFLVPFILSWALAYLGSERQLEWVYYTGLGGVTVSLLVLLVWLIH